MYEHPIYKSAVLMYDQAECDFVRDLCIKYELPIWQEDNAFDIVRDHDNYLFFYINEFSKEYHFLVDILADHELNNVNVILLEDFEALCEDLNPEEDITDIISRIKELNNIVNK